MKITLAISIILMGLSVMAAQPKLVSSNVANIECTVSAYADEGIDNEVTLVKDEEMSDGEATLLLGEVKNSKGTKYKASALIDYHRQEIKLSIETIGKKTTHVSDIIFPLVQLKQTQAVLGSFNYDKEDTRIDGAELKCSEK